jgi:hypothetical protein
LDSSFNNPPDNGAPVATPPSEGDLPAEAGTAKADLSTEARSAKVDAKVETPAAAPASPAEERFQSCRWRKAAENGTPEHCTHRDVLPMAGTAGFQPDSWCGDCAYFKAKRSPRKRPEPQNDNWRW